MRKAASRLAREWAAAALRRRDFARPTYAPLPQAWVAARLRAALPPVEATVLRPRAREIAEAARRGLAHRFDLLGSGPVEVRHGLAARGLEGRRYDSGPAVKADGEGRWLADRINAANLAEARRVWRLVEPGYTPIDWHVDFKSGYRWQERTWSREVRYGDVPGADVKVPWELARMQHLPRLALAFALAAAGEAGFAAPAAYAREFRNQVLDFVATNPPRFGVNWACTMDVAIRVANWLVARDLLRAHGAALDDAFEAEVTRTVYDHGRHIAANLEWSAELRSNHYLADIVGLLFAAAYLPRSAETDAWLALAVQELGREVTTQFNEDGGGFEASTSYHRLSGEVAVYGTAVVVGLSDERREALLAYDHGRHPGPPALAPAPLPLFPLGEGRGATPFAPACLERLEALAEFTRDATRPDGRALQIGDNDSGRFLKLDPAADGDALDHRHLLAAVGALFDRADLLSAAGGPWLDAPVVTGLAGGVRLPSARGPGRRRPLLVGSQDPLPPPVPCRPGCPATPVSRAPRAGLREGLAVHAYPDFGLYVVRSARLYLAARCGPVGQGGRGGHAHNDQLAIELCVDGVPFVVDPGTYLYTPAPEARNRFRSTAAHSTLAVAGLEQNRWPEGPDGLFALPEAAHARVLAFGPEGFVGEHRGFGAVHRRALAACDTALHGQDECRAPGEKTVRFHLAPGVAVDLPPEGQPRLERGGVQLEMEAEPAAFHREVGAYSPGYGVLEASTVLALRMPGPEVRWTIRVLR